MEWSGCGDDCRRTSNYYEALRCYELFGLAGVERTPISEGPSIVILNSAIMLHPTLLWSSPYHPAHKKF